MRIIKPKFWDKKISFFSAILIPLSIIYIFLSFLRKKFTITKTFNIPIICVGNIYIGGTGKTPTSMLLYKELSKLGKKPIIVKKYYKEHMDEYRMIKKNSLDLITCKNRPDGVREAKKFNYSTVILDDGFQDYKIRKDINIICFNHNQLIGNGLVLPSGPLRENLNSLKTADIILINGNENKRFEKKILDINKNLEIFYSSYKPINLVQLKNKKFFAIAGIGNPENFFQLIEENNLYIKKKFTFPDHYKFSKIEIQNIIDEAENNNCQLLMTEKDYFKIDQFKLRNINLLKVDLQIDKIDKLIFKVKKIYDKNN